MAILINIFNFYENYLGYVFPVGYLYLTPNEKAFFYWATKASCRKALSNNLVIKMVILQAIANLYDLIYINCERLAFPYLVCKEIKQV